ncbi:MAG: hypothetical protein ACLFUJ_05895 [Phycisphaerae bacterium]
MKLSPQDQQIVDRMQPGVLCKDGFLGTDSRSLGEILQHDQSIVESLDTSHEEIAEKLDDVVKKAMACYGTPAAVGPHLEAVYLEAMGRIPCPFGGEGLVFAKGEVELTQTQTGEVINFTPLSVHLIRQHGFYQGKGSRYRIDPEKVASMLIPDI